MADRREHENSKEREDSKGDKDLELDDHDDEEEDDYTPEDLDPRNSPPRLAHRDQDEESYREDRKDDPYYSDELEEERDKYEDSKEDAKEDEKEEEKKEPEELKEIEEVERQPLLQKNIVYARERSYCLPPRERGILEQAVMELPQKTELLISKQQTSAGSNKDFLKKLENDGIYKIGAVSEDMVTSTLTRPIDLSLRQIYRTKVRSAILCDRINSLKKKYFKLELLLGKIVLREHPLFIEEDT